MGHIPCFLRCPIKRVESPAQEVHSKNSWLKYTSGIKRLTCEVFVFIAQYHLLVLHISEVLLLPRAVILLEVLYVQFVLIRGYLGSGELTISFKLIILWTVIDLL